MENPDYGNLGDHTETVQVDYDPQRISYGQLLDVFWSSHQPSEHNWSRQYMNVIFFDNARQRELAMASLEAVEKKSGRKVRSEVLPLRTFYPAEDYHQKYLLNRRTDLAKELSRIYPKRRDFLRSTAVARLNGYVGGYGDADQLAREIDRLGLSAAGRQALTELVNSRGKGWFN